MTKKLFLLCSIKYALKDLLGSTLKEMMEAEMDEHPGYGRSERSDSDDYRNGNKPKRINSSFVLFSKLKVTL